MGGWSSKDLGDGLLAWQPLQEIEDAFAARRAVGGGANEMAVFVRHTTQAGLHCRVMVYFSPAAAALGEAFGASPCERPSAAGLDLLAGTDAGWAMLFPEVRRS
jgi:hypothetical protein